MGEEEEQDQPLSLSFYLIGSLICHRPPVIFCHYITASSGAIDL